MTRFLKRCPNCYAIVYIEQTNLYCANCNVQLYPAATKLCSGCGRFMAINSERNFLPHKFLLSDKWCRRGE